MIPAMQFEYPPSLKLANLPTPIERMRPVPEYPDLPNVYVKRGDLTGAALSGAGPYSMVSRISATFVICQPIGWRCAEE